MMQELAAAFNADLLNEVNTQSRRFVKTGTYTGQVIEVVPGLMRDGETYKLNLTIQLLDEDLNKIGRAYLDITPTEIRNMKGGLRKESELFYALVKTLGAADVETFVAELPNAVISLYGTEYFNGKSAEFPEILREEGLTADQWQKVFVNADEDAKRDVLLGAGLKSRFMVLRVGKHRG